MWPTRLPNYCIEVGDNQNIMDEIKHFTELKELIPILTFLLPGFLTAKVVDLMVITKEKDVFDKLIQAVVFTFINLLAFTFARKVIESALCYRFNRDEPLSFGNLFLMVICSLSIGLLCCYEIRNEKFLDRLREFKFTKKTYKPSTWVDVFSHRERFIVVHLEDGRRIYGWPRFYSDDPAEREIFLENASWLSEKNEFVNNPPIGILLSEKSGIQFIEFVSEKNA
jgi:Family of unknown function (DUF6338)